MQGREDFAKTEGSCTVTAVDGAAANGWACRCFNSGGTTQYSFNGPGFNGQWVKGEDGCPVTNPQSYSVTNPANGEIFCVQANCS